MTYWLSLSVLLILMTDLKLTGHSIDFQHSRRNIKKDPESKPDLYDILALTKPQQLKIIFTGNKIKLKWFSDSSIYACPEAVWQTKTKLCFIKYNYELWKALVSVMHILLWKCYSHFNMCMCRYVHILISNPFVP